MNQIEYTVLNYYHSPLSKECLYLGVLFHDMKTGQCKFIYISDFERLEAFDDEINIEFVKEYLRGIKDDVENSILTLNPSFDLHEYTKTFANEFKFSMIKKLSLKIMKII